MTLLYKAFGEVGNNTLNSVNSRFSFSVPVKALRQLHQQM